MESRKNMSLKIENSSSTDSEDIVRNFLKSRHVGVLATADKAGMPHAAVVYFLLEDDFGMLFGVKKETQKYKNMEENKHVAFSVSEIEEQTTVQISGHVEVTEDVNDRQAVLNNMFNTSAEQSGSEIPPADKLFAGDYVILRLIPLVIKMSIYARPDSEDEDDLHETLLFSES
jgi:general stress protein 26